MKRFRISIDIDAVLTVDELWPDGDAPANPTLDDVTALIDKCGGLDIVEEWNLADDYDIEVSEVTDVHRAMVDRIKQLSRTSAEAEEVAKVKP